MARTAVQLEIFRERKDGTVEERPLDASSGVRFDVPKRLNTLNRLMLRVHTRDFGAAPGSSEVFTDWTTVEMASTVVRPAEAVVVA